MENPKLSSSRSLDTFVTLKTVTEGISLSELKRFDLLRVLTRNSEYNILLLTPETGLVFVQGGRAFNTPVMANIYGAGFGGNFLVKGWVGIGMRLEIYTQSRRFITSPVKSISIRRAPAPQL